MCDHDLSPPPPDLTSSQIQATLVSHHMDSGKEVLLLKTLLVQVRAQQRHGTWGRDWGPLSSQEAEDPGP